MGVAATLPELSEWTLLLTDICLACRQALLGHCDTLYLFTTENNFHHSDDILQQISSFVCFRKGRISF